MKLERLEILRSFVTVLATSSEIHLPSSHGFIFLEMLKVCAK